MFKLVLQVLHCQSHHTVHGHLIPHCPRLLFTFWQRRKSKLSSPKQKLADFRIQNYAHIVEEFNIYLLFLADKLMTLFLLLWSEKQMTSEFQKFEQNSDQKISWSQVLFSGRKPTIYSHCWRNRCSSDFLADKLMALFFYFYGQKNRWPQKLKNVNRILTRKAAEVRCCSETYNSQ